MTHSEPAVVVRPVYTGFAPIATCHWQSIANILAAYGMRDAQRALCTTWGITWTSGEVLFGGGRWPCLLRDLYGVTVEDHHFTDPSQGESAELALGAAQRPFVAEIDAFYVYSPYRGTEHVVHTVIVIERDPTGAVILDSTNNPAPVWLGVDEYRGMRSAACVGRLDPLRLYVPLVDELRTPSPRDVARRMRADLAEHGERDIANLDAFVAGYPAIEHVVLPRVAAERHGAAQALDLLADGGVPGAAELAERMRRLTEDWFMAHMLSDHESATEPRQRRRIQRLLDALARAERGMLQRALELLP